MESACTDPYNEFDETSTKFDFPEQPVSLLPDAQGPATESCNATTRNTQQTAEDNLHGQLSLTPSAFFAGCKLKPWQEE